MKRSAFINHRLILVSLTLAVAASPSPASTGSKSSSSAGGGGDATVVVYIDDDWDAFAGFNFDASIHAPCTDVRPNNCTTWAQQGHCTTTTDNAAAYYMQSHCPVSCHVCHERVIVQTSRLGDVVVVVPTLTQDDTVVVSDLSPARAFGWHTVTASAAIEYDAVFVPGLGPDSVAQRLVVGHEEWIEECVQQLSDWAMSPIITAASDEMKVDRNLHHQDCLYFVVATEACQTEADQAFMVGNCAVACQVCVVI
jgi:ShK domain-like